MTSSARAASSAIFHGRNPADSGPGRNFLGWYSEGVVSDSDTSSTKLLTFGPPDPGQFWRVERMFIQAFTDLAGGNVGSPKCFVYVGPSTSASGLRDFTDLGVGDVADEVQPIYVGQGQPLNFSWINGTTLTSWRAVATIQYQIWSS